MLKVLFTSVCCFLMLTFCNAQQPKAVVQKVQSLPAKIFLTMRDSTTSMDIVMMQGKGGSMSLDGRNVKLFNAFFESKAAAKTSAPVAGNIMWQINGREYISGSYYLGDSTGFVVFKKDGNEYVNLLNSQGNSFFKGQVKQ